MLNIFNLRILFFNVKEKNRDTCQTHTHTHLWHPRQSHTYNQFTSISSSTFTGTGSTFIGGGGGGCCCTGCGRDIGLAGVIFGCGWLVIAIVAGDIDWWTGTFTLCCCIGFCIIFCYTKKKTKKLCVIRKHKAKFTRNGYSTWQFGGNFNNFPNNFHSFVSFCFLLWLELTFDVTFGVTFGGTFGGCEMGCETWVTSIFPLPVTKTFFFSLVVITFGDIETGACDTEFIAFISQKINNLRKLIQHFVLISQTKIFIFSFFSRNLKLHMLFFFMGREFSVENAKNKCVFLWMINLEKYSIELTWIGPNRF